MSYTPGPLPEPDEHWMTDAHKYTAEQLSAYAASEVARAVAAERERQQEFNAMASRLERAAAKLADEHELLRIESENTKAEALLSIRSAANAERERWLRVAEAAQSVTVGCEDQGEDFLLPSHLMASLALALDESPLAATRADPQRLQGKVE